MEGSGKVITVAFILIAVMFVVALVMGAIGAATGSISGVSDSLATVAGEIAYSNATPEDVASVKAFLERMKNGEIKCKYDRVSLGVGVKKSHHGGEQCKGYAKCVWETCFGITPGSTKKNRYELNDTAGMQKVGTIKADSPTKVKELFTAAKPGDFIQMVWASGGLHSAIVYSVTDGGTTWIQNNKGGNVTTWMQDYSWSTLASSLNYVSIYTPTNYKLAYNN